MKLYTEVPIEPYPFKISYYDKLMFIGSCFTENVGQKFKQYFFSTLINPFGVLYNPMSVAKALEIIYLQEFFTPEMLEFANGKWFSYYHHSRFSHSNRDEVLFSINKQISKAANFLKQTKYLFITFGTARVYRLKKTGKIVANCHKQPSDLFERFLLTPEQIINKYQKLISELRKYNPNLIIIFTISPIRHLKDGFFENNVNKSVLFLAINELLNIKDVYYFPSYEIVIDQLRDYRFYSEDLIHISPMAVNIIWEKISEAMIDSKSKNIFDEIIKIRKAYEHKPLDKNSSSYKQFIINTLNKIKQISQQMPNIDFSEVLEYFEKEFSLIDQK